MTSNQRRPGFRLPWSSEEEAAAAARGEGNGSAPAEDRDADEAAGHEEPVHAEGSEGSAERAGREVTEESELEAPAAAASSVAAAEPPEPETAAVEAETAEPATVTEAAADADSSGGFMRDLVEAMRRVADETRQASLAELRARSEEQVRALQAETETRGAELRSQSDADIAAVGDWARAEEERIKQEAEGKVVARRAQLEEQLARESSRAEAAATALRERVAAYERDLDAYHAKLSDITDPAAFATAAKQMPAPPELAVSAAEDEPLEGSAAPSAEDGTPSEQAAEHADATRSEPTPAEWASIDRAATANGTSQESAAAADDTAPTPEPASPAEAPPSDAAATEVLVKGLGSFGAITGFRQALAGVDGIDGVSLSLGPTGEFVFRALHSASFDVAAAIKSIEGDAATIEERSEGGLRVTLDRNR